LKGNFYPQSENFCSGIPLVLVKVTKYVVRFIIYGRRGRAEGKKQDKTVDNEWGG